MKLYRHWLVFFGVVCTGVIAGTVFGMFRSVERPLVGFLAGASEYGRAVNDVLTGPFRAKYDSDTLKATVASLEHDLAACRIAGADTAAFADMERITRERDDIRLVSARVIGINPDPDHSLLLINRGEADGVQPGVGVIAGRGIFVGKVLSATAFSSSIRLPIDQGSKIIATFASTTPSRGIVEGQFQVGLRMNLIPNTEEVAVDTPVVTSGLEQGIPRGLLIGRIRDIQSQPTNLFKSASLEPAIDYTSVRIVSVVVKKKK